MVITSYRSWENLLIPGDITGLTQVNDSDCFGARSAYLTAVDPLYVVA
jgi:hypothetical protein